MKEIRKRIMSYKELKASIKAIDIRIEELEEEAIGITAAPSGERTGATNKVNSPVETQVMAYTEKKDKLLLERRKAQRELNRIDNALSVLSDKEKDIIVMVLINKEKYTTVETKYYISYPRIKQIEQQALEKIKKYF